MLILHTSYTLYKETKKCDLNLKFLINNNNLNFEFEFE